MTKHPDDLRAAIAAFVEQGNSRRAAARHFGVSPSFVIKMLQNSADKSGSSRSKIAGRGLRPASSGQTLPQDVTGLDLALLLGVSTRSVTEFALRGIIVRHGRNRFALAESIQTYCEHIRVVAAGRGGEDAQALSLARARLATEQADNLEMKNARERGELLPRSDVHLSVTEAFTRVRAKLLAMPSKLAPLAFGLGSIAEVRDAVTKAIHEALAELSGTIVHGAPAANDDESSHAFGSAGLVGGAQPAPNAHREPVGGP